MVIAIGSLTLAMAVTAAATPGFRAQWTLEEGDRVARYQVDYRPGRIHVAPKAAAVRILIDLPSARVTLLEQETRTWSALEAGEFRRMASAGIVPVDWFPWVYTAAKDLVEETSLEGPRRVQLPDGRWGVRYDVRSGPYDRKVASYWLDPDVPQSEIELFFQWTEIYSELWGEGTPEAEAARRLRFQLYERLPGLPMIMEERFVFLHRPRILRIEGRSRSPEEAFQIPEDFEEKTADELSWETWTERLLEWLGLDREAGPGTPPS